MDRIMKGGFQISSTTQTAGTAITAIIPGKRNYITRLTELIYTSGTTQHTLIVMRPIATTTLASAAAAGASTLTLTAVDSGKTSAGVAENLAASDWLAWEQDDGTVDYDVISSINTTTKVVTLTGTNAVAAAAASRVWLFYEPARPVHFAFTPQVALATYYTAYTTRFGNEVGGVAESKIQQWQDPYNYNNSNVSRYCPLLIYCANATAAGRLVAANGYYATT
jgi:hypothetical protein